MVLNLRWDCCWKVRGAPSFLLGIALLGWTYLCCLLPFPSVGSGESHSYARMTHDVAMQSEKSVMSAEKNANDAVNM